MSSSLPPLAAGADGHVTWAPSSSSTTRQPGWTAEPGAPQSLAGPSAVLLTPRGPGPSGSAPLTSCKVVPGEGQNRAKTVNVSGRIDDWQRLDRAAGRPWAKVERGWCPGCHPSHSERQVHEGTIPRVHSLLRLPPPALPGCPAPFAEPSRPVQGGPRLYPGAQLPGACEPMAAAQPHGPPSLLRAGRRRGPAGTPCYGDLGGH